MMWRRKRKSEQQEVNLLDLVPVRLLDSETGEDGSVCVLKPRYTNRLMVRFVMPRMSNPNARVSLDAFGSHVWQRIDGSATVRDIGTSLREAFGEEVEPVFQRLGLFCKQLAANQFIRLTGWPDEPPAPVD